MPPLVAANTFLPGASSSSVAPPRCQECGRKLSPCGLPDLLDVRGQGLGPVSPQCRPEFIGVSYRQRRR